MANLAYFLKGLWLLHLKRVLINHKNKGYKRQQEEDLEEASTSPTKNRCIDKCRKYFRRIRRDRVKPHWKYETAYGRFYLRVVTGGTFENYIAASLLGYFCGLVLSYLAYILIVVKMETPVFLGFLVSSALTIFFTLGLAFTQRVRILVALTLPYLCGTAGRQCIAAYGWLVILGDPYDTLSYNMKAIFMGVSCEQGVLLSAIKYFQKRILEPVKALKKSFIELLKKWKKAIDGIEEMLKGFKKIIKSLVTFLELGVSWLNNVINMCSLKVGTPFQRCTFAFEDINDDCKALVGSYFSYICAVTDLVGIVCYVVKPIDYICQLITFASGALVKEVSKRFKLLMSRIGNMLYMEVKFHKDHKFKSSSDQNLKNSMEVAARKLVERASYYKVLFRQICTMIQLWTFVALFVKVFMYKRKFLKYESFDNHLITHHVVNFDIKRSKCRLPTIFPLSYYERKKYYSLTTMKLSKEERKQLIKAIVKTFFTTIKMASILAADYVAFIFLVWLRKITRDLTDTMNTVADSSELQIEGSSIFVKLLQHMNNLFSFVDLKEYIDAMNDCMRKAKPINLDSYVEVGIILATLFIFTIFQPYALRLRNVVLNYYYPDVAHRRAIYLYKQILTKRSTFLTVTQRALRRNFGKSKPVDTFMDTLKMKFKYSGGWWIKSSGGLTNKYPWLTYVFGHSSHKGCLVCSNVNPPLTKCLSDGCSGVFCSDCYKGLKNKCTICKKPMEYGDLSDISEVDQSDEDDTFQNKLGEEKLSYNYQAKVYDPNDSKNEEEVLSDVDEEKGLLLRKRHT